MRSSPWDTYVCFAVYNLSSQLPWPGKSGLAPCNANFTSVARSIESICFTTDSHRDKDGRGELSVPGLVELAISPGFSSPRMLAGEAEGRSSFVMTVLGCAVLFWLRSWRARSPKD